MKCEVNNVRNIHLCEFSPAYISLHVACLISLLGVSFRLKTNAQPQNYANLLSCNVNIFVLNIRCLEKARKPTKCT